MGNTVTKESVVELVIKTTTTIKNFKYMCGLKLFYLLHI